MPENVASMKSTNDRSPRRGPLVRGLFRVLSGVSPAATTHLAARIFFTPPRATPSARTREALSTGARRTVDVNGLPVRYWTWGNAHSTVYLLHGWGGIAGQLTSFVQPLLARGFKVVACDAPGHGESGGATSNLLQFSRALRAVAALEGPAHAVIAHSLGGAAAAHALSDGLDVTRAVFLGVPADIGAYFRNFLASVGIPEARHREIERRLEERFGFRWTELAFHLVGPRMSAPLLVLHDKEDQEIPWSDGAAIARAWPGATLVTTEGLGHRRILRDPAVLRRATEFVATANLERSTA